MRHSILIIIYVCINVYFFYLHWKGLETMNNNMVLKYYFLSKNTSASQRNMAESRPEEGK